MLADEINQVLGALDAQSKPCKDTQTAPEAPLEQHKRQFKGRNSYSKTDPVHLHGMKEDHTQRSAQTWDNMQVGTENGFAVNYSIHSNPTDTNPQ
jgi:hypothetical protein